MKAGGKKEAFLFCSQLSFTPRTPPQFYRISITVSRIGISVCANWWKEVRLHKCRFMKANIPGDEVSPPCHVTLKLLTFAVLSGAVVAAPTTCPARTTWRFR
jgi:hypothetical protein